MFPKIERKPDAGLLFQAATWAAVLACVFGLGWLSKPVPEPKTVTVTHDAPPACLDALNAATTERAHLATAAEHDLLASERAAERFDAELTRDDATIADAADALEAEQLLVQQARLDAGTAAAAFDEAAAECREVAK